MVIAKLCYFQASCNGQPQFALAVLANNRRANLPIFSQLVIAFEAFLSFDDVQPVVDVLHGLPPVFWHFNACVPDKIVRDF